MELPILNYVNLRRNIMTNFHVFIMLHSWQNICDFFPAGLRWWVLGIFHFALQIRRFIIFFCFHLKTIFIHNLVSWRILQFSKINSIKWNPKPTYRKYKILSRQTNYNDLNKIPTWQLFTSIWPAMVENWPDCDQNWRTMETILTLEVKQIKSVVLSG